MVLSISITLFSITSPTLIIRATFRALHNWLLFFGYYFPCLARKFNQISLVLIMASYLEQNKQLEQCSVLMVFWCLKCLGLMEKN